MSSVHRCNLGLQEMMMDICAIFTDIFCSWYFFWRASNRNRTNPFQLQEEQPIILGESVCTCVPLIHEGSDPLRGDAGRRNMKKFYSSAALFLILRHYRLFDEDENGTKSGYLHLPHPTLHPHPLCSLKPGQFIVKAGRWESLRLFGLF